MQIIQFLVSLMGATMLLLYAVKLVQTGVERSIGSAFKRVMSANSNPAKLTMIGTVLAIILQSSTAVSILSANFVNAGTLAFISALPIVLGADLGSAIVVQILSFKLDWLMPLLLGIGGWNFLQRHRGKL